MAKRAATPRPKTLDDIKAIRAGPPSERQIARMSALGIAPKQGITFGEAWELIAAASPHRGNRPPRNPDGKHKGRKGMLGTPGKGTMGSPYVTKAVLDAAIEGKVDTVLQKAADRMQERFNEEAPKFYEALTRLRDKADPDIRAVVYGLDRIMGKVVDKTELSGDVQLTVVSKIPRPESQSADHD